MVDGDTAFEVGARYRTRVGIDALRDRFAAGEVLVYWRFGSSRYDDARGWFFRQPGTRTVRSYDLLGGAPLDRDALFERVADPPLVIGAVTAGDLAALGRALDAADPTDPEVLLDHELATERALVLDRPACAAVLIARGALDPEARVSLLHAAAQHGRATAISQLVATGTPADAASPAQQTALVAAVFGAHLDAVRALLAAGADPNHPQPGGASVRKFARDPAIAALLDAHEV